MADNYYLGQSPEAALGDSPRYIYMVTRNDDGELFLVRSDQLKDKEFIDLNKPGDPAENFEDFEPGIDFFEGTTDDHEIEYDNLVWTQYRWDNRSIFYYVDDDGQLVQRINFNYEYPTNISSDR